MVSDLRQFPNDNQTTDKSLRCHCMISTLVREFPVCLIAGQFAAHLDSFDSDLLIFFFSFELLYWIPNEVQTAKIT